MAANKEATRHFSEMQEAAVAKALGGSTTPSSGAGRFSKGDVLIKEAGLEIECKTCMKDKDSFSIKKEWISKSTDEARSQGLSDACLAFNFGPGQANHYVIGENLMSFLVESLAKARG